MSVARIGSVLSQIAELSELGPNLGPNGHIRAAGGVGHVVCVRSQALKAEAYPSSGSRDFTEF